MASTVKIVPNPAGIDELMRSNDIGNEMHRRAEAVLGTAVANAPVDTGKYRAGLGIEDVVEDVAYSKVGSSVDYAIFVEAESGNILRALDEAGGA